MYDLQLEKLVDMALEDGVITEKEKTILVKRAKSLGVDLDEFEMYLDSRLASLSNTQKTTPSQKKFGELLKCPSCGASVPSFTIICKDCGFEFRNISVNSSVKELSEKLEHASMTVVNEKKGWTDYSKWFKVDDIKSQIVNNFPIPNTKDDLMEFAIFISHNISPRSSFSFGGSASQRAEFDAKEKWNVVWIEKYKQIIFKARLLCKDDTAFIESIINLAEKRQIKVLNQIALFLFIGGCILSLFSIILHPLFFLVLIVCTIIFYCKHAFIPYNWGS